MHIFQFPNSNHIFILSGIKISFNIFVRIFEVSFIEMISYSIESIKENGEEQAIDFKTLMLPKSTE